MAVAASRGETFERSAATPVLRRLPYPYRAMLAICSDLDETPDRQIYYESARFLNTAEVTSMGPGVGLEVGNTIYFDMPPDQFAYWNTDDHGRAMVRALIQSGHIDCLHSFGDLAVTRRHAGRALDDLARHDCSLQVWIDHATAPTNFGADIMRGTGDVPGAAAYHADLTCAYGIRYIWRGRVTSMIGQGVRPSLAGIFDLSHPVQSAVTTAKEFGKVILAGGGYAKYVPHAHNQVTFAATLRDGRAVVEFLRSNPHFRGPSGGDTAVGLPEVLTDRLIDRLVDRGGLCVLYTHLGKIADPRVPFGTETRAALRRLAQRMSTGDVLVTTTRRLLGYEQATRSLEVTARRMDSGIALEVRLPDLSDSFRSVPADLEGLTWYVEHDQRLRLLVNGRDLTRFLRSNPPDTTGRESVSIPWRRLEFPAGL